MYIHIFLNIYIVLFTYINIYTSVFLYVIYCLLNMDSVHLMSWNRHFGRAQGPGIRIINMIMIGARKYSYNYEFYDCQHFGQLELPAFQNIIIANISDYYTCQHYWKHRSSTIRKIWLRAFRRNYNCQHFW